MKYYEANFTIHCLPELMQDARDVLSALAGEAGFETFEETDEGLKGYVQQTLFDQQLLDEILQTFPFGSEAVSYSMQEAEDRDWNEQWEQEGFAPIVVDGRLVVHDGRHLPDDTAGMLSIEIDARLAFGTGTHETTRMICATLLSLPIDGKRVLDCGTGTGILSICALKLGAARAVGYDIDEWSVDNARHNAVINGVDSRFESLHGDASVLQQVNGDFDLVLANINRNILLADLPAFCQKMAPASHLVLSGFYTADTAQLVAKGQALGLELKTQQTDNDWACLVLQKV